jgi:hypothetical protein
MTTISPTRKLVTLINVFTVEPGNQERLLDLLARATETSVRHAPGFTSASLQHRIKNKRSLFVSRTRPCILRRRTIN